MRKKYFVRTDSPTVEIISFLFNQEQRRRQLKTIAINFASLTISLALIFAVLHILAKI